MDHAEQAAGGEPRRTFLKRVLGSSLLLLSACTAAPAAPTTAPTAAKPNPTTAAPAASPAVSASPSAPASAVPAVSPSVAASPSAAASPAATTASQVDPALGSTWAGKTLNLIIGSSPGGGYDTWGRIVARYLGKHLPGNPTVVPQNMPGGVHRVATNFIFTSRPDGLTMGIIDLNIPFNQLRGEGPEEGVRYDVTKLNWLGSTTVSTYMPVAHQRTGISAANLDELKTRSIKMGLSIPGDPRHTPLVVLREVLGWQMESIFGYPGSAEIYLGIQRNEVDGTINSWDSYLASAGEDLRNKVLIPFVQLGVAVNDPLLTGVPNADTLAASAPAESRQLLAVVAQSLQWARPFVTPPEMPANVLATMRAAFLETLADPELKTETARLQLDVTPVPGERVQSMIQDYMKIPRTVVDRLDALIKADSPS